MADLWGALFRNNKAPEAPTAPVRTIAEEPVLAGEIVGAFSIAAAAVQGPSHLARGAPGDDRFAWKASAERICAIVCDGAGSAPMGRVGAERASADMAADLISAMAASPLNADSVRGAVAASISALTRQLLTRYPKNQLADFHATVVGAIWDEKACVLFHIGDGAAAALESAAAPLSEMSAWSRPVISEPENGESIDQTFFFTMTPLSLRVREVGAVDAIVLMSDGAAALAYVQADRNLESGFFAPLAAHWAEVKDCAKMASAFAGVMTCDEAKSKSEDDKCLLVAVRHEALTRLVKP